MNDQHPGRGQIWWVDLDPTRGSETYKTRPAESVPAAVAPLPGTAAESGSAGRTGTVHYDMSSTEGISAMPRSTKVEIFTSFEDENEADRERWARMSSEERLQELAVLLERQWGKGWTSRPMERTAWWEKVSWGT